MLNLRFGCTRNSRTLNSRTCDSSTRITYFGHSLAFGSPSARFALGTLNTGKASALATLMFLATIGIHERRVLLADPDSGHRDAS
ncbi:hypothetical protein L207DRAFT_627030 [Hyaloscypha variabilis F]|uniref:Uncharacterized protein n=1 Tax=Hyaloscypha variabilis (strain UAMH 11265 / GT02V1 / F) TaxID=1149755 RepID=A0A2J6SBY9_HYAVF|nr:hypothetical protein L207DRAFT_627030 [Hyaloscypha variabilis F]